MAPTTLVFDASVLSHKTDIPPEFVWEERHQPTPESSDELLLPTIDLSGFFNSDNPTSTSSQIAKQIDEACTKHGFFQVTGHNIDPNLLEETRRLTEAFFTLPLAEKERGKRKPGEIFGYASSFIGRFTSNLPWKETLTFPTNVAEEYVVGALGQEFHDYGKVLQEYSRAMNKLCLEILEVLGVCLEVGRSTIRDFYADNESICRVNYYPPCQKPELTLGIGPHHDPTSITVLFQDDHVAGLQVFVDGKWYTVSPKPNTFVINIGDTFMALTNKRYKSCLHRGVVNTKVARKSIVYFLCPRRDKIVRPLESLVDEEHPRAYPDFTWAMLEAFTQKNHRVDYQTADAFAQWLLENKN